MAVLYQLRAVEERPDDARPENPTAELRWVSPAEAAGLTREENLRVLIQRVDRLLAG